MVWHITVGSVYFLLIFAICLKSLNVVVMSCEVYGNYDSAVRRWSGTGSCAVVGRGYGALSGTEDRGYWDTMVAMGYELSNRVVEGGL